MDDSEWLDQMQVNTASKWWSKRDQHSNQILNVHHFTRKSFNQLQLWWDCCWGCVTLMTCSHHHDWLFMMDRRTRMTKMVRVTSITQIMIQVYRLCWVGWSYPWLTIEIVVLFIVVVYGHLYSRSVATPTGWVKRWKWTIQFGDILFWRWVRRKMSFISSNQI